MSKTIEIFFNASQHIFDLGLSETLMIRNFSSKNKWQFCSMIGGSESIRDLEESKNLYADAYEFPLIESIFAMKKIFSAIKKVFLEDLDAFKGKKLFITIGSIDGLGFLNELNKLSIPSFLNKKDIIFIFDRRMIIRSLDLANDNNFDVSLFEPKINIIIDEYVKILVDNAFQYCISGGITEQSLRELNILSTFPHFIKAGMFTFKLNENIKENLFKNILKFQSKEAKLLNIMKKSIYYKNDYINVRELYMIKYLIDSI